MHNKFKLLLLAVALLTLAVKDDHPGYGAEPNRFD